MKRCYACQCDKPESEFHRHYAKRDGRATECKICSADRSRKWRLENPEEEKNRWYKRKYGLSLEQYNQMLLEQGGVCAICNQPESKREQNLSVDHDHGTGEIRALLCSCCNTGLGEFRDREYLLVRAADYLRRFSPVTASRGA